MRDITSKDYRNRSEFIPTDGSAPYQVAEDDSRLRLPIFPVRAVLGMGLLLSPVTGNVSLTGVPDQGLVQRSSVLSRHGVCAGKSLRELADTAEMRMTPEQRALYEEIVEICDTFGEPVDVNSLLREIREDV